MEITVLTENTKINDNLISEHGLCLYIKTDRHTILVDTGQTDALITNADILGTDLKAIDNIFLSHGHYDHCGGVIPVSNICKNADIYLSKYSFKYFHDTTGKYIGIDNDIKLLKNIRPINGFVKIDDELSVFSEIKGRECFPFSNKRLLVTENNITRQDDFIHEQCVVINENNKYILVSGCAHNGIVNIIEKFHELYNTYPDAVISGFHFMKNDDYTNEEIDLIKNTAYKLNSLNTVFYTGHCTGSSAIEIMTPILKDKLKVISTGLTIQL